MQNLFTSAKILSLLLIILLGALLFPNHKAVAANFGSAAAFFGPRSLTPGFAAAFGAAMVGGLFSADAWACVTFAASEVKNPRRDLPLALAFGTAIVIVLYVLSNIAYLCELPTTGSPDVPGLFGRGIAWAASDRVAAAAMEMVWRKAGATVTALLVMVSTFGCSNGLILTGARVIYAMARDGVFFASAARLNETRVPAVALVMQGIWASLLTLSGTYSELLDYVIFAQLLFYALTVVGVFILRKKHPSAPRPYRTFGYPYVPLGYITAALAMMADLLIVKPHYTWPGLLIVISGVPVYAWFARSSGARA